MLIPAVHFPGTCARAIAFYQEAIGAKVESVTYHKDAPADSPFAQSDTPDWVMHAVLSIAGSRMNMCDTTEAVVPGNMYRFNVFLSSVEDVIKAFERLSDGGRVLTPLSPQFWTPMYGDVEDSFGVLWQIMAE